MSLRLLAAALGIALAVVLWLSRPAPVSAPLVAAPATPAVGPSPPEPAAPAPPLTRDPFQYAEPAPPPALALAPALPQETGTPAPVASPETVRLAGFVRQGPVLKAVLSLFGTTVVVSAGETAEGYRVLAVDEDSGVRLRSASGEELQLKPFAR